MILKGILFVILMLLTPLLSVQKNDEDLSNTMWTCSQYDITQDRIIFIGLFFTKDGDDQVVSFSNDFDGSFNYKNGLIYGYKDGDSKKKPKTKFWYVCIKKP